MRRHRHMPSDRAMDRASRTTSRTSVGEDGESRSDAGGGDRGNLVDPLYPGTRGFVDRNRALA